MRAGGRLLLRMRAMLCGTAAAILLPYSSLLPCQGPAQDLPVADSALAAHLARVMKMLPPESGPPTFVDLSKDNPPGASKKWEARFSGSMKERPILDPGVHTLDDATSISMSIIEFVGQPPAIPVKTSVIVAVGVPGKSSAHLAQNERLVYSLYQIRLDEIWKDDRKKLKGGASNQVVCGEVGGSVRFLSGHVGTFLEAKEGYLKLGAKYVLFLWQQIPKDRAYMLNEGYLLQQGRVFPVKANFEQSHFAGMPEDQFLKAVKSAIKGGIDIQ